MDLDLDNLFALKKPCANCPFRKEGAIRLAPGRLKGIIDELLKDDWSTFHCHKTVHNARTGGEWTEDGYECSGKEATCAGAVIYLEKAGRPSVGMRLGALIGKYDPEVLKAAYDDVIDPEDDKQAAPGRS